MLYDYRNNAGELQLSNSVFNLDGTFGLGDLGTITRSGGTVQVTGTLNGGGGILELKETTGNGKVNGGQLCELVINTSEGAALVGVGGTLDAVTVNGNFDIFGGNLNVINGLVMNGVARVGHPSNGSIGSRAFNGSQVLSGSGSVIVVNACCNSMLGPVAG